jgi:hypothetical protein
MRLHSRAVLLVAFGAAIVVFCVVQDRVTAAGARQYVALQRGALAAGSPPVTIDEVMRPAVGRSVRQGFLWGGLVMGVGVVLASTRRRRRMHGGDDGDAA